MAPAASQAAGTLGRVKCPHCLVTVKPSERYEFTAGVDVDGEWRVRRWMCPACLRFIIGLALTPGHRSPAGFQSSGQPGRSYAVWPRGSARAPAPPEVPQDVREEYAEAALVLADSPKASAALSRRCLQRVLRGVPGVKPGNLAGEIDAFLGTNPPSYVADQLHALREVGNFAAHPNKSQHTGEVMDVEPGEAEWNLEVLESLFDYLYVQPAKAIERKEALDKKLKEAGKNGLKQAPLTGG